MVPFAPREAHSTSSCRAPSSTAGCSSWSELLGGRKTWKGSPKHPIAYGELVMEVFTPNQRSCWCFSLEIGPIWRNLAPIASTMIGSRRAFFRGPKFTAAWNLHHNSRGCFIQRLICKTSQMVTADLLQVSPRCFGMDCTAVPRPLGR